MKPFYTPMKEKKNASAANDSANGGGGGRGRATRARGRAEGRSRPTGASGAPWNNGLYVQKLRQGLWAQAAWVQIPALTPKGHAIGAKLLHFSGSQFRHL